MEPYAAGLLIGGRYTLGDELGRGTSGVVYRAHDRSPNDGSREVALKVMNPSYGQHPEAKARFLREARVTSVLDHPGAVDVLDYGEHEGLLFLTMPVLPGESLRARFRRGPLSVRDIATVGAQVADVLFAAHEIDLIHRDIKPENIFVTSDVTSDAASDEAGVDAISTVRVLDFGLAFLAEHDGSLGRLTQDGVLGGTPAYMSPEQAQADPLTAATDIYSLGCILYEAASGELPFSGSVPETLARHIYVTPVSLTARELPRPIPLELATLVDSMLSKATTRRPSPLDVAACMRTL